MISSCLYLGRPALSINRPDEAPGGVYFAAHSPLFVPRVRTYVLSGLGYAYSVLAQRCCCPSRAPRPFACSVPLCLTDSVIVQRRRLIYGGFFGRGTCLGICR